MMIWAIFIYATKAWSSPTDSTLQGREADTRFYYGNSIALCRYRSKVGVRGIGLEWTRVASPCVADVVYSFWNWAVAGLSQSLSAASTTESHKRGHWASVRCRMLRDLPRVRLGHFPTPIDELQRLSSLLGGPRLLVKRDDLTGLATGGNKTRKLEYLIADALDQDATTVITAGAAQSNHARQTAAAAARYGLQCVLVLAPMAPPVITGNLLIDDLLGARVRWTGGGDPYAAMKDVALEEREAGRRPYIIPVGGSNAIGASAYVAAMDEAVRQALDRDLHIDHIVVASGSGGTQAGLVAGARASNFWGRILGISVSRTAKVLSQVVLDLAQLTADSLGLRVTIDAESVQVNDDYLGDGYGVMGEGEREAIRLVARQEGLLLDPVYTGRAMSGLIDMIRRGEFTRKETVLFWHTGGTPALFAYADQLLGSR